ncbi:MAG TPA: signal peptidase II [Spirochaetia bacterium]|nr:signal peptidase II [Spirochaetia bacterium]
MDTTKRWVRSLLIVAIVVVVVAGDQASKIAVRADLKVGEVHRVVGDVLIFVRAENNGAFLSLGSGWSQPARRIVFGGFTAFVTVLLLVYLLRSRRMTTVQTIALAAVAGGGVSNIVDRLTRDGLVTDFLNLGIGSFRVTGIFNLADFFILSGVIAYLIANIAPSGKQGH